MRRTILLALTTMLYGTTLAAQQHDPGFHPGSMPLAAGISTTVLPILAGVYLMAASKGDVDVSRGVGGFFLASTGLLLGPAIGDWAGGLGGRGFARFGLRTAALAGAFAAGASNNNDSSAPALAFFGGVGLSVGLAVWDLATLKSGVRQHQARTVSMMPTLSPDTHRVGVAFRMAF